MWRGLLWIVLLWLAGITSTCSALRLATNISPPYQQVTETRLTGESVETVRCVLNTLGHDFSIDVVPWKRAQSDLQHGRSDGYFSAIPQSHLDAVATLTAPIVLEKWFWFAKDAAMLQQPGFPSALKVGVLRGSNQEEWLQRKGSGLPSRSISCLVCSNCWRLGVSTPFWSMNMFSARYCQSHRRNSGPAVLNAMYPWGSTSPTVSWSLTRISFISLMLTSPPARFPRCICRLGKRSGSVLR